MVSVIRSYLGKIKNKISPKQDDYKFTDLNKIRFIKSDNQDLRINLIITTINKNMVFGGIKTALDFFFEIMKATDCKSGRIIVLDSFSDELKNQYPSYKFDDSKKDSDTEGITVINMPGVVRNKKPVFLRKNDYFITTY